MTTRKASTDKLTAGKRKQAKELYLGNPTITTHKVAKILGVRQQSLSKIANIEGWQYLRNALHTNSDRSKLGLLTTMAELNINLLLIELKALVSYSDKLASLMSSKTVLALTQLKAYKAELDKCLRRCEYIRNKLAGSYVLAVDSNERVEDDCKTVHALARLSSRCSTALRLAKVKEPDIIEIKLGTFSKAPKANLGDIDTAESVDKSETKPTKASNRVYKPMRRN